MFDAFDDMIFLIDRWIDRYFIDLSRRNVRSITNVDIQDFSAVFTPHHGKIVHSDAIHCSNSSLNY